MTRRTTVANYQGEPFRGGETQDLELKGDQEAVCLTYGGGFLHWCIVIGPPGSVPDPNAARFDNRWIRWSDGIYDWQQG